MEFKKKKNSMATMSSYLPEEILQEIFLRLPKKSVLRFRCVNKFFCALFDSRSFKNMYHQLTNLKDRTIIVLHEPKHKKLCSIHYKSLSSLLPLPASSAITICDSHVVNRRDYHSIFKDCDNVACLSSINGFDWIITIKSSVEEFYICNPTTKEYSKVPKAREVKNYNDIHGYGFGYDYKTKGNYKLVRVVDDWESRCSYVDVYMVSSNSWKSTQRVPYILYHGRLCNGLLFKGDLHWLVFKFEQEEVSFSLVCFDIAKEKFQEVALPEKHMPYPEEPLEGTRFRKDVENFGGCLCLVFHVFNVRVDIWMMQEYGVRESWAKSFSITLEILTSCSYSQLIWNFKNNETLWLVDRAYFVLYDPNNKICRKLEVDSEVAKLVPVAENCVGSVLLH